LAISPDTKDWTWVLRRPCPECGVDVSALDVRGTGALTRRLCVAWAAVLREGAGAAGGPAGVAVRPAPGRWSPLEYGCHVRDVLRVFGERLGLMLAGDGPDFPNWDQDATAVEQRYDEQDPDRVAGELVAAGTALADGFDAVAGDGWSRTGHRSDGAVFTVDSFARYFVHDPLHHLWDVGHPLPL
jgi:hypothetical protein